MTTSLQSKSKASTLTRHLSDQTTPKPANKKKKLVSSRSDRLESRDSHKLVLTSQDSKLMHNINLQIPSANSPNVSNSINKKKVKKEACIKGYTSKLSIKSPRSIIKSKKSPGLKDSGKLKDLLSDSNEKKEKVEKIEKIEKFEKVDKKERASIEKGNKKLKILESEIKKALDENKKLKKVIQNEVHNEEALEDLMKGLKSRLMKFLYE